MNFDEINDVLEHLKEAQGSETSLRDRVNEAHNFLEKRDGQWEPEIIQHMGARPRYTFDKCNPVVDGIAGEIQGADFDIRVRPMGGDATKDIAKTYDGLIRNIETISNASDVYSAAARDMVGAGIGGWEIIVDWVDGDSFNQDFIIRTIHDYENRVWFDPGSIRQDKSDAKYCFVLDNLMPDEFKERFPDAAAVSVGDSRISDVYYEKPDFVTVGRIIYIEEEKVTLALTELGEVYEVDEEFDKIRDELALQGNAVVREREKDVPVVYSRLFNGDQFLTDPERTVFKGIPVIPCYGNFNVREGKVIYYGAIENIIDAQRVYNYARSREVEDLALTPPDVMWASRKQLSNPSDRTAVENMNTSAQRVYTFTPDPENPGPPSRSGGPNISPGLQQLVQNSIDDIQTTSSRTQLQNGDLLRNTSELTIQTLTSKADTSTLKYFKSVEIAVCRTARILVDAIPSLYDSTTKRRILNEDGSYEMVSINKTVMDMQTGQEVKINDLSQGKYDVTCQMGEAFVNRQDQTVKALTNLSAAVPGVGEMSADILLNNISAPGVDIVAERVRRKMLEMGMIPESQYTQEEGQEVAQAQAAASQQTQEPTAEDKIANAEIARVQAETQDVLARAQLKQEELRIKEQKDLLDAQNKAEKLQMEELMLFMKQQAEQSRRQQEVLEATLKGQAQVYETLNTQADTLNKLREAMGVDAIVGPNNTEAYKNQAEIITDQQESI